MARKRDNYTSSSLDTSLSTMLSPAPKVLTSLNPLYQSPIVSSYQVPVDPRDFPDGRQYHPQGVRRPQQTATGQLAQMRRTYHSLTHPIGFENPFNVIRCIRRQARREVLFAFNKQRKRGQSGGKYRRNYWSQFKC